MSLHEVPFRSSALDHMIASYKGALTAVLLDQIADSPAAGSVQVCSHTVAPCGSLHPVASLLAVFTLCCLTIWQERGRCAIVAEVQCGSSG